MNRGKAQVLSVNLLIVALIAGSGFWGWRQLHPTTTTSVKLTTATVSTGNVTASVSASGKVISPGDVAVAPTSNGILTAVFVKVGDHVNAGQALAQLDNTSQQTGLQQATASLTSAKASLDKLTRGRTAAEQKQADLQLAQSKSAVDKAQKTLDDQTSNATANALTYQSSVDAAKKSWDDAKAIAALNVTTYQNSVDQSKTSLDAAQTTYDNYLRIFSGLSVDFCNSLAVTSSNCTTFLSNYNSLNNAKNSYASALQSQTLNLKKDSQNLASLEASYNSALNSQSLNLKKDAQSIATYKTALADAQAAYELQVASQAVATQAPRAIDLEVAQASITTAEANYQTAVRNLAATTVKAPVAGDVASIASSVGQTASAGTSVNANTGAVTGFIVLTNVSALRVQASFSEADAAKIAVGQPASFSFEALPSSNGSGSVSRVDLLPTTANNVVSYTVILDLSSGVPGLKPGMTTTATIITGSASNVLQVSAQAVTTQGNRSTVRLVKTVKGKQETTSTPVVIGLKGDSTIEIKSGLKTGDTVAISTSSRSSTGSGFPQGGVPAGLGGVGATVGGGGGFGGGGGRNG
jgi:RND family efflux transporter MFP subunit